jgi:hypothetical protein
LVWHGACTRATWGRSCRPADSALSSWIERHEICVAFCPSLLPVLSRPSLCSPAAEEDMVEAAEDTPAAVEDTASVAACAVVQPADSVVPPLVQA